MTASSDGPATGQDWLFVAFCSVAVFAVAHRLGLASPYVVNDDVRQQIYWMARFLDPALYPPDLLGDYAAAYVPPALKALYFAAAKGFGCDPILFSKLLTGGLFVTLALAFFGLGAALEGRVLGYACAAMACCLPYFLKNISGGLSRSFAPPLLALFFLAWLRRSGGGMALTLLAQALFIPYIAVLSAFCACLDAFWCRIVDRPAGPFPARPWHGLALVLAAGLVWSFSHSLDAAGFGPLVGRAGLAAGPEFSAAGRLELYPLPNPFFDLIYWPFEGIGLFLDIGLVAGIASLAVLLPFVIVGARRAPWPKLAATAGRPAAMLLAGSLLLYALARIVALKLFVPDRYIAYTINLLYALSLAVVLRHALAKPLSGKAGRFALLALALGLGLWRLSGAGLYDYRADAPLYAAVRELPKEALVAGNPELLDTVLTFGRRNVFASFELAHPWSVGYWERYFPRLAHQIDAYYAKDPLAVLEFARAYGVSHMVVREADLTAAAIAKGPLFAPFTARIKALADRPGDFALLDAAVFPYTSPEPGLRLVDLRPLLEKLPPAAP
ncbi:MAG: hypothetical protein AAGU21_19010 [Solidesulfovibrio sp.]|uniref:hypothetical protein n=1 Tax=Solidesulfovibrio sp. TaxID=2910990 RepID=UPI002B1F0D22|nr:hypothetical protein [Solidesulfovibrio sp.]MEA4858346.1 hypothetical protein [Solidesulfovibrio sp.]